MLGGMPNYRRYRLPGGTWFFTVNLLERRDSDLLIREIDLLRGCVAHERARRPFAIIAWVVLPEHMHCIWRLPEGDTDYPTRWRRIKTDFSRCLQRTERRSSVRIARGERGLWQRRYWEHAIRNDADLHNHIDYIHYNPVKHGLVAMAADWPYSSFYRHARLGLYPLDWSGPPMCESCDRRHETLL
jgi:putative transposase